MPLWRATVRRYDFLLRRAIEATPDEFKDARVRQAVLFGQKLRRYTGLNHLAKAARAVLSKPEHVKQMQVRTRQRVTYDPGASAPASLSYTTTRSSWTRSAVARVRAV